VKRTLREMLSAYKRWVSPALPVACRFVPTCSEYALEAVDRHGPLRGGLLAGWRLLRSAILTLTCGLFTNFA